ncbi:Glycosyl hydrolases family 25 [Nonomuraea maritima]|uniref:Glycosyl hydrolases family 25 n=1 Tax=Nonomuraea maritima TaxID=683260 RepID=A0A1G9H7H8_9ACTN|nr:GH25 family lysozyme [Nonomuraea maritima]SDL08363.1 Glycosyl hydrolases family 25 [Nonomuraea maritima]
MLKPWLAAFSRTSPLLPAKKRLGLAVGSAVLCAGTAIAGAPGAALAATADQAPTQSVAQSAGQQEAEPLTYGLDVSNYQPDFDWNTSPAQFGIIKATEGLTFTDKSFARHWQRLGKKGIVRGAYHFAHPDDDPVAEAKHFLAVVNSQPAKPGDLLVLDLETTDGESVSHVNAWAKTWLAYVKQQTGITPMFYSSWNFANRYGAGLEQYPLWVADYNGARGQISAPANWKTWTIHQYTDSPIDQNVSTLSVAQLRSLGRKTA